jgi:hypothetical protein
MMSTLRLVSTAVSHARMRFANAASWAAKTIVRFAGTVSRTSPRVAHQLSDRALAFGHPASSHRLVEERAPGAGEDVWRVIS